MPPANLFLILDIMTWLGALLLLGVSVIMRSATLRYWGGAYLAGAIGIAGVVVGVRYWPWAAYGLGPALVLTGYWLMWMGLRQLRPGRPLVLWPVLVAAFWCVVSDWRVFAHNELLRLAVFSPAGFLCMVAIAHESLRIPARVEVRWLLAGLALLHAAFYAARSISALLFPSPATTQLWLYITPAEAILYEFCDAFLILFAVLATRQDVLRTQAHTDHLTGLLNRRRFFELAQRVLQEQPCAVLVFDVDYFKTVNDTHGHAGGDEVLQVLGEVCRAHLRKGDLIGRVGGDEFAMLIRDDEDAARRVAARIREAFTTACQARGYATGVTFGVISGEAVPVETLLAAADAELYIAKRQRSLQALPAPASLTYRQG